MARQLRSTIVYEALRKEIMQGELEPGARLATRAIAQRFEVSDIPVREALWMLGRDGLIENTPYAGARVRTFTQREILEAYEVRAHLESLAIKLGAGQLDDEHQRKVEEVMDELQSALDRSDLVEYGRLNRVFHELIIAGCRNRRLLSFIEELWDGQASYQMVFRLNPERARTSQAEHREIVDAVFNGDGDRASELIVKHRRRGVSALVETTLAEDLGDAPAPRLEGATSIQP